MKCRAILEESSKFEGKNTIPRRRDTSLAYLKIYLTEYHESYKAGEAHKMNP